MSATSDSLVCQNLAYQKAYRGPRLHDLVLAAAESGRQSWSLTLSTTTDASRRVERHFCRNWETLGALHVPCPWRTAKSIMPCSGGLASGIRECTNRVFSVQIWQLKAKVEEVTFRRVGVLCGIRTLSNCICERYDFSEKDSQARINHSMQLTPHPNLMCKSSFLDPSSVLHGSQVSWLQI